MRLRRNRLCEGNRRQDRTGIIQCLLYTLLLLVCSVTRSDGATSSSKAAEVRLPSQMRVAFGEDHYVHDYSVVSGGSGEMWVVAVVREVNHALTRPSEEVMRELNTESPREWVESPIMREYARKRLREIKEKSNRLLWRIYDGQNWSDAEEIKTLVSPDAVCSTQWDDHKPIVIWRERKPLSLHLGQVWQIRWDKGTWMDRRPIPGVATTSAIDCCQDGEGTVHLMYCAQLSPQEVYRIGPDSESPRKPYHMISKDLWWSRPEPIVGKSRWYYRNPKLSVAPSGTVHVVAPLWYVGLLGRGSQLIEHRTLTGNGQVSERISDPRAGMDNPSLAIDNQGNLHLVYAACKRGGDNSLPWRSRYRVKRAGSWSKPKRVGQDGYDAVIANDKSGRIYCCWKEQDISESGPKTPKFFLKVWNTQYTSKPIELSVHPEGDWQAARFFPVADGTLCLAWIERNSIVIQKLSVQEPKSSTTKDERQKMKVH